MQLLGKRGKITLALREVNNGGFELVVKDNGVGLPEDLDVHRTTSFGLYMVRLLAEGQLEGQMEVFRTHGTDYRICFKMPTYSM